MHTYRTLLGIFYQNAIMTELEYRLNLGAIMLLQLLWLLWSAVGARVPFAFADRIAGWSYPELLVVLGICHALLGYREILLAPNLSRMSEHVRLGTLDFILTKPVNTLFMISLRHLDVTLWATPLYGLGLIGYGLWRLQQLPNLLEVALFLVLTIAAMLMLYSFNLALQSLTFWLVDLNRADTVVSTVIEAGRVPVTFYHGWVRFVLTAVIPVAFLTTFPAQALLGRLDTWLAGAAVGVAVLSLGAAVAVWRVAVRSYTSASS